MNSYNKLNNLIGWLVFLIASYVYLSTIEPTASFWDCGEYIATATKLEVGHPPGAPFFQLLGRFFSLFAFGDVTKVAMMVNAMSALCSAFTILFLFWSITALLKKILVSETEMTTGQTYAIIGSGLVGSLAYTFSDSFWFSAVEGEVYAMSSLFTAAVFWAILKWEQLVDKDSSADRWLILIAYLVGLSVGVHLLNLLALPAIVFIYYFKKYEVTKKGLIITFVLSVLLLGGVQSVIIPGIVSLAANFELLFVNSWGLPFNSGTIFYFLLLLSIIVLGLLFAKKPKDGLGNLFIGIGVLFILLSVVSAPSGSAMFMRLIIGGVFAAIFMYLKKNGLYASLSTIVLCFTVLLIGYSSFFLLVIRSQANTPIDENNPENAINLLSYLNREQYGDWPILYGQYYNAPLDLEKPYKDGTPVYVKEETKDNTLNNGIDNGPVYKKDKKTNRYIISDDRKNSVPNYDKRFCTVFPRMWSQQSNHEAAYKSWGDIKGERIVTTNYRGERETLVKPTFGENLRYFISYQVNWMYLRYFCWNFVGKQNDVQGHGGKLDGNWITGVSFIDGEKEANLPPSLAKNKAKNKFYGLPLILGIIGLLFHFSRKNKDAFVVLLLFLFTGMAIVVYLNQYPYQPRERDYAYAASFYAFAIWIGIGVYAIFDALKNKLPETMRAIAVTAVCLLAVPTIMAKEGWDDHDRSNRYTARDFAKDYLDSCAPNAILFTNGDNDTFPLWYVQEVEGYRTDVRVINLSLLNTDWYIDQMKRKAYNSDAVPLSLTNEKYRQGTRDYVPIYDQKINGNIKIKELIDFVSSDVASNKIEMGNGSLMNYFPTKNMSIPVDKEVVLKNGTVSADMADRIVPAINWTLNKNVVMKNDLMVLDLLAHNNWQRPIYFAVTTGPDSYLDLQDYFQLEGLAYRLVPIKNSDQEQQTQGTRVATKIMYDNIMNKFSWGNIEKPGVYLDENILRMTMNLRIQMGSLASALVAEGKKDSAVKVLDKCMTIMPEEKVPFDATIFSTVLGYYQADAFEKANTLAKKLFSAFEEHVVYYASIKASDNSDARREQDIMQRLIYASKSFKQDALSKELEERFTRLANSGVVQMQQYPGR